MTRLAGLMIALCLGMGSAALADNVDLAADVSSYKLAEAENPIAVPRIEGHWVAYYDGRDGRFIYDLTTRTKHDRINQWSNIPYDLGQNYLIDAERQNMSYYNFEKKSRYKWKTSYEVVGHLLVGDRYLAMTWSQYDQTFKMHLQDVVVMRGGGNGERVVQKRAALADIAMEHDLVAWADYRYDQAGVYTYNTDTGDRRRISESDSVTLVDTDGTTVVWKDDTSVRRHDVKTGLDEILFFKSKAERVLGLKIDGPWLVYQDDAGSIFAHHLPSGKELRVNSGIRHKGTVNLADVSDNQVLFTVGERELWVADLPETVE